MALATSTGPASLVSELMAQGRESAAALEALLQGASPPAHGGLRALAAQILRCCDRALAALHSGGGELSASGCADRKRKSAPGGVTTQARPKRRARASGGETPTRVEKKRTAEDGFIWRKYGQKDIQNSKYPRMYFRCTYKYDSGCRATRQVQQSEDEPSLYVITYFGEHTCSGDAAAVEDDGKTQSFVINFGSATASGGSPWLSSDDDDDVWSKTSHLSQAVCLPEEADQPRAKMCKVESPPPAAEPSSSADASCASPVLEPGCLDWDYFGESSFDNDYFGESSFDDIVEFVNFDEFALFQ